MYNISLDVMLYNPYTELQTLNIWNNISLLLTLLKIYIITHIFSYIYIYIYAYILISYDRNIEQIKLANMISYVVIFYKLFNNSYNGHISMK